MAVTDQTPAVQLGWIDPREESAVEKLELRADISSPIDLRKIEMIYDRPSDTFSFLFYGRGRPSVVIGDGDPISSLADPETGELLGIQIEDFFAFAAVEHPQLLEAVEHADLRGITREQARKERAKILGYRGRLSGWVRQTSWRIKLRTRSRRRAVVGHLFNDDSFGISTGPVAPVV